MLMVPYLQASRADYLLGLSPVVITTTADVVMTTGERRRFNASGVWK